MSEQDSSRGAFLRAFLWCSLASSFFLASDAVADLPLLGMRLGSRVECRGGGLTSEDSRLKRERITKALTSRKTEAQEDFFEKHFDYDHLTQHCAQLPEPAVMREGCRGSGSIPVRSYQDYLFVVPIIYEYNVGCHRGRYQVEVIIDFEFPNVEELAVSTAYCDGDLSARTRRARLVRAEGGNRVLCKIPGDPNSTRLYRDWILREAAGVWNRGSTFGAEYIFRGPRSGEQAHFSVSIDPGATRGPYFHEFASSWSPNTVAHEVGHMMGLNDEYSEGLAHSDCRDKSSIMCDSQVGGVHPYHEYLILRRWHCGTVAMRGITRYRGAGWKEFDEVF